MLPGEEPNRWLLLEPFGGVGQRLAAVASARLLARDLERDLVLAWRPEPGCNVSWDHLVGPAQSLRVLRPENQEVAAVNAGAQLLRMWSLLRRSRHHEDLLRPGKERLQRLHMELFREGAAQLLDVESVQWRACRRLGNTPVLGFARLQAKCICVRAADFFYPPREEDWEGASKELSQTLRRLQFSEAVRKMVWEVFPGTIGLHVPRHPGNRSEQAFSPLHLLELEMTSFPNRGIFLATDDLLALPRLREMYGLRLEVWTPRTDDKSRPEYAEDMLVQLLSLARADKIFGTVAGVDLRVIAVLSGKQMHTDTVFWEEETGGPAIVLADPVEPRGPFFVVGSWNDWKDFAQLMPSTTVDFVYTTSVNVRKAPGVEEFQIVQNRSWNKRFFPSSTGAEILGPEEAHGSNWRVKIPPSCAALRILWDPRGARSLTWRFVGRSGMEWGEAADDNTRLLRSSPYAIAGTWDNWKEFTDLIPLSTTEPTFTAKIRVRRAPGSEEFQIVQDREWNMRFYPLSSNLGSEIRGPDSKHGSNFQVQVPPDCRWLRVEWDPRGDRSVQWQFLDQEQVVLESPVNRRGPFFLVGTWDNWEQMLEMLPAAACGPLVVSATVTIRPDAGIEEFLIVQDRDWDQCFYPSYINTRKALGPDSKLEKGQFWRVRIRSESTRLHITFTPGTRGIDWHLTGQCAETLPPGRLRPDAPSELGCWSVLGELGRGWAGGVVYKAEAWTPEEWTRFSQFTEEHLDEAGRSALACAGKWWQSTVQVGRAAGSLVRGCPKELEERWQRVRWPLLLRALCYGEELGAGETTQVVAVDTGLCDAIVCTDLKEAGKRRLFLSALSRPVPEAHPDSAHQVLEAWFLRRGCTATEAYAAPLRACFAVMSHISRRFCGTTAAISACSRTASLACARARSLPLSAALEGCRTLPWPGGGVVRAVKSPVPLQELRMLSRLQGLKGLPDILDIGVDAENRFFSAMTLLGPSLEDILLRCDHDGVGGRMSWQVARELGSELVRILRSIHGRGVVHCDMKPANIMVGLRQPSIYVIDFGLAGRLGAVRFKQAGGTMPYNSVAAGYPGPRTPADDLESVGWMLLRCLLGHLPWQNRSPQASRDEPVLWQKRSEGMSLMKEWFLADSSSFGEEWSFCPAELKEYILGCQRLGIDGTRDNTHLARWDTRQERWARFVEALDMDRQRPDGPWRTLHIAARGFLVWRTSLDAPAAKSAEVPAGLKIRTTGAFESAGGMLWLESDPVWTPRSSLPFADGSWLLLADERGPLLAPMEYKISHFRKLRT